MRYIMWLIQQVGFSISYLYLLTLSIINGLKSRSHPPVLRFENPYAGQKILLVALYEKGVPRPDIQMLMRTAKEQGAYVLAVNTLRFIDPSAWQGLIDCYIEKHNFGRDFSSYQAGFLHLYSRGWEKTCPRVLMLNDSVFYCSRRTPQFVADLFDSEVEALGATENFEIEHHIGSFCVAMAGRVVAHDKVRRYWHAYRNTDLRPLVIRRGEMGLSKTLKRTVATDQDFRALYDVDRFSRKVRSDETVLVRALNNARDSLLVAWPTTRAKDVLREYRSRFALRDDAQISDEYFPLLEHGKISIEQYVKLTRRDQPSLALSNGADVKEHSLIDLDDLIATAMRPFEGRDPQKVAERIREMVADRLIANFVRGSHIHQNATSLLDLGLAIVKIDGMYRGMFSPADVRKICALLMPEDSIALERLLLSRPYGEHNLRGLRRAAFRQGLL
jgi:hypothetical protein